MQGYFTSPAGQRVKTQLYGYLLLLPALVFLLAFTHYPALATLRDSLYQPRTVRPRQRLSG